jgi:valine--pyruvate aminotransferase
MDKHKWSILGEQFTRGSGIMELMDDLGKAMSDPDSVQAMLGGGNPASIPQANALWRKRMEEILATPGELEAMLSNYDTPQGKDLFLKSLADYLSRNFGWKISEKNITITTGSQQGFFLLFNFLAGEYADGSKKKILFPLCPEYIGYADQLLEPGNFQTFAPKVETYGEHEFKYFIDFDKFKIGPDCGAVCVSRPTNPTGNVLTDQEIEKLIQLTMEAKVPLIVDNAYGLPFPGVIYTEANVLYEPHMIYSLSLSKLGLPGVRTGIIIANEEVTHTLSAANAILTLANTTVGQVLTAPLLDSGQIDDLVSQSIRPYYEEKSHHAQDCLRRHFGDRFPWRVHKSEGAFFLWLWFPDLPISTKELYEKLKNRGVIVVPGEYFFFGIDSEITHKDECLRLSFIQDQNKVDTGIQITAEVLEEVYNKQS